jgi:hypothetical protein
MDYVGRVLAEGLWWLGVCKWIIVDYCLLKEYSYWVSINGL